MEGPLASFTGDGAYDQDSLYRTVIDRDPDAAVIVPPRATAVPSETAGTAPTPRDQHLRCIAEKGKIVPRRISGVCAPHQRRLSDAIKKARNIALLPFASAV